MPDNDVFAKKLKPGWHKACKYLTAGASTEEVAYACLKTLVNELKAVGGCPDFDTIAAIVYDYCRSQLDLFSGGSYQELFTRFQKIEAESQNHPITKLALEQARQGSRNLKRTSFPLYQNLLLPLHCSAVVWIRLRGHVINLENNHTTFLFCFPSQLIHISGRSSANCARNCNPLF